MGVGARQTRQMLHSRVCTNNPVSRSGVDSLILDAPLQVAEASLRANDLAELNQKLVGQLEQQQGQLQQVGALQGGAKHRCSPFSPKQCLLHLCTPLFTSAEGYHAAFLPCQESKAAATLAQRVMADVQRSNNEVASLNAYLQVGSGNGGVVIAGNRFCGAAALLVVQPGMRPKAAPPQHAKYGRGFHASTHSFVRPCCDPQKELDAARKAHQAALESAGASEQRALTLEVRLGDGQTD